MTRRQGTWGGRLAAVFCAAGLVVQCACGAAGGAGRSERVRAWVESNQKLGLDVVVLRVDTPRVIEARIAPAAGANMFSLSWDGVELLYRPDTLHRFDGSTWGIPVLYPTPCRIPGGKFTFRGERFDFGLNRDDTHIHGLVRDAVWEYEPPRVEDGAAVLHTWIEFKPGSELYRKFPFEHRLDLTYSLDPSGLKLAFSVDNHDNRPLPFGFGLHPYWNYAGGREGIRLSAPVAGRMELENLVPTGKIMPVEGAAWDIRQPVEVAGLRMDDVFTGMRPEFPARIQFSRAGLALTLETSPEFGHLIVYDQPENPFFCVENLTSSPDAHNLYARGFEAESGLLVVPPGGSRQGWVRYALQPLK
ncbi:hypothetical protein LLH00_03180 [bacterium]|nr:hypothetical protein [bacterium]